MVYSVNMANPTFLTSEPVFFSIRLILYIKIPKLTHDWLILFIGNSVTISDELDLCCLLMLSIDSISLSMRANILIPLIGNELTHLTLSDFLICQNC
jgi:hypothetical protein